MKIFFDANVLFAACYKPTGTPAALIEYVNQRKVAALSSSYAWSELKKAIQKKAPSRLPFLRELKNKLEIRDFEPLEDDPIELRSKDIPIFRAALYHSCSILVTGDRNDFANLMSSSRHLIKIMTPKQCLDYLIAKEANHDATPV